jgi:creatinine amidohydrolase/Fe(II)-dependent formamide hydrolase-like protein
MNRTQWLTILTMCLASAPFLSAQTAPDPLSPDPGMARPIDAVESVFIDELTWLEVRDALRAGKDTVLVGSGGVEMNGPYVVTDKHQYVVRAMTGAIARLHGKALVAPTVQFVPEGEFDPPTSHMRYPGTVGVSEETFKMLLTDIAKSFKATGFKHIVFLGDSGGNQVGMAAVADELNAKWADEETRVHYIEEYYLQHPAWKTREAFLRKHGIVEAPEGHHDNIVATAIIYSASPDAVRAKQRRQAGLNSLDGIELDPEAMRALAKSAVDELAEITVKAIHQATKE